MSRSVEVDASAQLGRLRYMQRAQTLQLRFFLCMWLRIFLVSLETGSCKGTWQYCFIFLNCQQSFLLRCDACVPARPKHYYRNLAIHDASNILDHTQNFVLSSPPLFQTQTKLQFTFSNPLVEPPVNSSKDIGVRLRVITLAKAVSTKP